MFRMRRLAGIIARSENRRFDNRRNAAPLAPPQSHPSRHPRLDEYRRMESAVGLISIQPPRIYAVRYFREGRRSISGGNENGGDGITLAFGKNGYCSCKNVSKSEMESEMISERIFWIFVKVIIARLFFFADQK